MVISVFWIAPQILQFWVLSLLWVRVLYMFRNKGWVITYCELNCVKSLETFFGSLWVIEASKRVLRNLPWGTPFFGPDGPKFKMGISRLPNEIQSPMATFRGQSMFQGRVSYHFQEIGQKGHFDVHWAQVRHFGIQTR